MLVPPLRQSSASPSSSPRPPSLGSGRPRTRPSPKVVNKECAWTPLAASSCQHLEQAIAEADVQLPLSPAGIIEPDFLHVQSSESPLSLSVPAFRHRGRKLSAHALNEECRQMLLDDDLLLDQGSAPSSPCASSRAPGRPSSVTAMASLQPVAHPAARSLSPQRRSCKAATQKANAVACVSLPSAPRRAGLSASPSRSPECSVSPSSSPSPPKRRSSRRRMVPMQRNQACEDDFQGEAFASPVRASRPLSARRQIHAPSREAAASPVSGSRPPRAPTVSRADAAQPPRCGIGREAKPQSEEGSASPRHGARPTTFLPGLLCTA